MRSSKLCLLAIGVLCLYSTCLYSTSAFAGLTLGTTVSGPGGIGFDGGSFANVTEPVLQYSSMNYLDVIVTVDSAGIYDVNEAPGLGGISNFTGQAWAGFQIINLTPEFGSLALDWSYYTSPFNSITNSTTLVVASGGIVPSGTGMAMFGGYITNGPGTFILREIPLAVPEPSTITLLGTAGLMLGACALRRKRSA